MDLLKTFDDQIAQSEERIQKYTQLLEQARTDPEMALTLSLLTQTLESERAHKQKMQEMRARQLQVSRRVSLLNRRAWVVAIVAFVVVMIALATKLRTHH